MTRHVPPPSCDVTAPGTLLLDAARCWRAARDARRPVQPSLFNTLSERDCGLLAPVFDSLLLLYEAALGHRFVAGAGAWVSEDELLLLGLLDGTRPRLACIDCGASAGAALDCAICSTRIMMALTVPRGQTLPCAPSSTAALR